ncbi:lytic transglycosylase domain-containing protein [Brumicola pallidula]|nr:lytic transglycosylase domain-containing protein [Glaciecola pallidula]
MSNVIVTMYCLFLIFGMFLSDVAFSLENRSPEKELESQRAEFLRIEKQVWSTSDKDFATLIINLGDYPLVPYLIEKKILHGLTTKKVDQVSAFLKEYKDTPLERRVLRPWLRYLAKKNRKSLFTEFYAPMGDIKLTCRYLRYQLEDNVNKDQLYSQVADLWNVSKSQPKDCDPLFKKWKADGQLNEELILQRIAKAANGGQYSIIAYLRTLLPEDKKYLADLWYKTRKSPSTVKRLNVFKGHYPYIETEIISYGLGRLIWRNKAASIKTWERAQKKFTFTDEQQAHVANRFAISMAISRHQDAEYWLIKSELLEQDPEVLRWHLATLLKEQKWPSIINLIEKASPTLTRAHDYQYWLARSYAELGNDYKANELFKQLAGERHYYGFLASARLEQSFNFQNQPLVIEKEVIERLKQLPSAKRAFELKKLGRFHEARLEWRFVQQQLDDQERLASAVIASQWGWHDQAIFTFTNTGYLNDVNRRFPMAYSDILTKEAQRNKIDPEWAFAIARRESSFMSDAVSSAKAFGLMQVLPSTARYLEKKRVSNRALMNPNTNAKLGNKYLRYLMDKVDNNTLLATASYNAGWSRVKSWLPTSETVGADLWIETIPYRETRNYVKAVMAYKQIYQHQLFEISDSKTPQPIGNSVFGELVQMQIPITVGD